MRRKVYFVASLCLVLTALLLTQKETSRSPRGASESPARSVAHSIAAGVPAGVQEAGLPRMDQTYARLPLAFEANAGQADAAVKFLSRGRGYTLFLTPTEAVLALAAPVAAGVIPSRDAVGARDLPERFLAAGRLHRASSRNDKAAPGAGASTVVRLRLVGANAHAEVAGADELPGKSNYFIGNDPAKWRTNVPTYARVKYRGIYPGVDLVYYGNQRQLEHDFIVAPGADPSAITLRFEGAEKLSIDAQGDLVLTSKEGEVRLKKPVAYQDLGDMRQEVAGSYVLKGEAQAGFQVAAYDVTKPLVIDPVLVYSTYLGGSGFDQGQAIAVDSSGNAYVTGYTASSDFPTTPGAFQTTLPGVVSAFVTKINPAGSALVYSTYLGGSNGAYGYGAYGFGIAVDSSGNAYVTGYTASSDFPITAGAFQTTFPTTLQYYVTAFVAKINPDGSALAYSTFLGGSGGESGDGIAVDSSGNAYVTGSTRSSDFPTTPGAFQTTFPGAGDGPAFVAKINPDGSALVYSTYLAGSQGDHGHAIAVDSSGNAYVTGRTRSTDFPTTAGAFQTTSPLGGAFVTKINADGSALLYSTYLGGSNHGSDGRGIAVDSSGNAYVTGLTFSNGCCTSSFPTTPGAFQTTTGGSEEAFVTKLNAAGSTLVYSTFLGGSSGDIGYGIAVDSLGNAYVTGNTRSSNFPTTADAFQTTFQLLGGPAFVATINPDGSALVYSTFLGGSARLPLRYFGPEIGRGIAVDSSGNAYVTGSTRSSDFPTTAGAFQTTSASGTHAFVTKINVIPNTPAGTNVNVPLNGGDTIPGGVSMTFGSVTTTGNTTLTNSSSGPTPPAGFNLGSPATYYEISTTATFTGSITVCINYAGISLPYGPQLFHFEGGGWVNVTTSVDTVNQIICGSVSSLSPFVILQCGTLPTLSVSLSPNVLWPPNHKLVPITASISVTDACDASPNVVLVSITANESLAPGDITGATFGTDDRSFNLAASRSGSGNGRIYTVTYKVTDHLGRSATASATVTVPHDQGKP